MFRCQVQHFLRRLFERAHVFLNLSFSRKEEKLGGPAQALFASISSRRFPKGSKICARRRPSISVSIFDATPVFSHFTRISSKPSTSSAGCALDRKSVV